MYSPSRSAATGPKSKSQSFFLSWSLVLAFTSLAAISISWNRAGTQSKKCLTRSTVNPMKPKMGLRNQKIIQVHPLDQLWSISGDLIFFGAPYMLCLLSDQQQNDKRLIVEANLLLISIPPSSLSHVPSQQHTEVLLCSLPSQMIKLVFMTIALESQGGGKRWKKKGKA